MKKYAVIGSPISHSRSPSIHSIFGKTVGLEIQYDAIEVVQENFETAVKNLFYNQGYEGLNVTLPLKELAYHFALKRSDICSLTKAANTLWLDNEEFIADTTDGKGLVADIESKGIDLKGSSLLILGAGGSAKSVLPSLLEQRPDSIKIINRTFKKAGNLATLYKDHECSVTAGNLREELDKNFDGVINTTSAGVLNEEIIYPNNLFATSSWFYDLNYSDADTPFNHEAKLNGCVEVFDGLGMLFRQAAFSFEIWTGLAPNVEEAMDILSKK
jgi:shikimate dehydrogenase|tara:strand:+ start:2180 stop:2995 length:816 start_codon:yes stop_codon:yes gene_type:complete